MEALKEVARNLGSAEVLFDHMSSSSTFDVVFKLTSTKLVKMHTLPHRSSNLDVNIKEALEALKQDRPASRASHGRKKVKKKLDFDLSQKILTDHKELQEFIQLEQELAKEVKQVTVYLSKPEPAAVPERHSFSENLLATDEVREQTLGGLQPELLKPAGLPGHRRYIQRLQASRFSDGFTLQLIFFAWRSFCMNSRRSSINSVS